MELLIGIFMLYSWIHGGIIVAKKIENLTGYERFVLIAGGILLSLYVLGVFLTA